MGTGNCTPRTCFAREDYRAKQLSGDAANPAIEPGMSDVIDLGSGEGPGELRIVLECRGCGEEASPIRRADDPKTAVRCRHCSKKHHVDSLEAR